MPNSMKHTVCKICDQNLKSLPFDKYQAHIDRHLKEIEEQKPQTGLEEFS